MFALRKIQKLQHILPAALLGMLRGLSDKRIGLPSMVDFTQKQDLADVKVR